MRYLSPYLPKDLAKKMVFVSGPRQAGKTTLVKSLLPPEESLYLCWDDPDDRKVILNRTWADEHAWIALDEIHKFSRWKNFLKGTFDKQRDRHRFIVTGSARLDIYKRGQDSMVGRYFSWRLHPFCLAELRHTLKLGDANLLDRLLMHGGFPEPFLEADEVHTKRWRHERRNLVFRQDIRDLEAIRDISLLEIFYDLLRERVGGEIVLSNLARDLEIAPKTAKAWLNLLEKTYTLFVVSPYSANLSKAVVKAPKVYFYDNGEVQGSDGARFENLVANHLHKRLQFLEDSTGNSYSLHFIRDQADHEVDFVVLKNRKPVLLVEAKLADESPSRSLYYLMDKLKIPHAIQLVRRTGSKKRPTETRNGVSVTDAETWLSQPLESDIFA